MSKDEETATAVGGHPMKRCPVCRRWSILTAIDGKPCIACSSPLAPKDAR